MRRMMKAGLLYGLMLMPAICHAAGTTLVGGVHLTATLISIVQFVLLVTSVICIAQFFNTSDTIHLPFHMFNLLFIIAFYSVSMPFLINNIDYYDDGAKYTTAEVLHRFFFSFTLGALKQWVIISTGFLNIIYIARYWKDYYDLGMPMDHKYDK